MRCHWQKRGLQAKLQWSQTNKSCPKLSVGFLYRSSKPYEWSMQGTSVQNMHLRKKIDARSTSWCLPVIGVMLKAKLPLLRPVSFVVLKAKCETMLIK